MPKTPESGGIPLPPSWPPFNRDMWEDRAHCLLESLSRMGHEHEEYAMVPMAVNSSKRALAAAERQRVESSISTSTARVKSNNSSGRSQQRQHGKKNGNQGEDEKTRGKMMKKNTEDEGAEEIIKEATAPVKGEEQETTAEEIQQQKQKEDDNDEEEEKEKEEEEEEEEEDNRRRHHVETPVKPTKALKTYEQRRKYLTKAMDMHRRTIGGGRSGRRGRAECVAFLRYVLEVLDEQYEEALAALGGGEGDAYDVVEGGEEEEEEDDDDVSSSDEEEEEEEQDGEEEEEEDQEQEEGEEEVEEEQEQNEKESKSSEGHTPKSRQQSKAAPAPAPASAPQPKRGPGRPPRSSLSPATSSAAAPAATATTTKSSSSSSSSSPPKTKAARIVINEQDFFDQHNDLCEVCNKPGEVLCCATCNLVFHVRCARPRLRVDPPDDWKCAYCWESGIMGGRKGGKERRRAAIACREMERMRREIREARERRMKSGDDDGGEDVVIVESEEEEEEEEEEETEEDEKETSGPATLAQAAAAGCRKCARELETGEKTSRTHDDICPRKWKGVGKRPSAGSPMNEGGGQENFSEEEEDEKDNDEEEEEGEEGEDEDSNSPSAVPSATSGPRDGGMVSLEVGAAAGCIKCQKELETGEKTRKTHVDHCPRKYRGAYIVLTPSSSPPPPAGLVEVDSESQKPLAIKDANNVVEAPLEHIAESEASLIATTPAQPRRKVGRPPSTKKAKSNTKQSSTPSSHSPLASATLAEAAAAGCIKCQKELATGEKTRKTHNDDCPRKWKAAGRPPVGTPSPASAEAALARQQEAVVVGNFNQPTVVAVSGSSSLTRNARSRGATFSVDSSDAKPPDSPRARRGKRTRDNMLDTISTDTSATATDEAIVTKRVKVEENKEEGEDAELAEVEEESSAIAAIVDLAKATAKGHKEGQPGNSDGSEEKDVNELDDGVLPLRGGGDGGVEDMTLEASMFLSDAAASQEVADCHVSEGDANNGGGETHSWGGWDQSLTALDEMDICELTTSTLNIDEFEGMSANTGRVQRSRKKPEMFTPTNVADSKWTSDGDIADETGASTTSNGPEPLRGGARPKKEDIASNEAATTTPKRGRPPTKQTKKGGANKKNAKRAPIKKETNDSIAGVGVLNRKPGSLFDCSACLDLSKIHICCYCACRLCFNKFGKEQTILCDKCDQEYHTFCLGLDKIPDEEWECPACIDSEKKKIVAEQRKKEREAKKKMEEEKRKEEEAKKEVAAAKRRVAYQERKKQEEESRKARETSSKSASNLMQKRGPGRPPKSEAMARIQAQFSQQNQQHEHLDGQPQKRGRGRPRKDGGLPIPRKLQTKSEISTTNMYIDTSSDSNVERSRSGRKIQRTVFHDEMAGGGLMKRARTDDHGGAAASASRQASIYLAERSAAAAAKSAIAGGANASGTGKKEPRRKPGARECMQISRKFGTDVIDQKYFDVLMDYSKRAKVDHLIRMRERLDEHTRFLESQLAGLEALAKKNGEWDGTVPAGNPKAPL